MKVNMDREGLPYNAERNMSYNSRLAQELSKWAESKGKSDEIHSALFRAYFVDVKNIGKVEPLVEITKEVGLPADEATDVLMSRSFKSAVDDDWRRCALSASTLCRLFSRDATSWSEHSLMRSWSGWFNTQPSRRILSPARNEVVRSFGSA
jgi:hypothetical protein